MRLPLHAAARRGTGNVSTTRAPLRAGTRDVLAAGPRRAAARGFTLLGLPLLALARRHRAGGRAARQDSGTPLALLSVRLYPPATALRSSTCRGEHRAARCRVSSVLVWHANAFLQFHTALRLHAHEELESPFGNGGSLKRNQAYYRSSGSFHKMQ